MRKCAVGSTRNRSSGSNVDALRAVAAHRDIASATRTASTAGLGACTTRMPRLPRRTSQNDAQDECGHAEQPCANEEESVPLDQRTADGEPLDPDARESLR